MAKVKKCRIVIGTIKNGKKPIYCGMPLVNDKCPDHGSKTSNA